MCRTSASSPGSLRLAPGTALDPADGEEVQRAQPASVTTPLVTTVVDIHITPDKPTVVIGQAVQLTAAPVDAAGNPVIVSPSTLVWKSSNTAAATVDASGKVTGVSSGSTNITVSYTEFNQTVPGKQPDVVTVVTFTGSASGTIN